MKRIGVLILCIAMFLSLAACSGDPVSSALPDDVRFIRCETEDYNTYG